MQTIPGVNAVTLPEVSGMLQPVTHILRASASESTVPPDIGDVPHVSGGTNRTQFTSAGAAPADQSPSQANGTRAPVLKASKSTSRLGISLFPPMPDVPAAATDTQNGMQVAVSSLATTEAETLEGYSGRVLQHTVLVNDDAAIRAAIHTQEPDHSVSHGSDLLWPVKHSNDVSAEPPFSKMAPKIVR